MKNLPVLWWHHCQTFLTSSVSIMLFWGCTLATSLLIALSPTPSTSLSPYVKMSSTTRELSPSSASSRAYLLKPLTPAASLPQQWDKLLCIIPPPFLLMNVSPRRNVPDSTDTLPGHATDHFVYAQQPDSAQQPKSGSIHPWVSFYSESQSHENIPSYSSGSERLDPQANQTPADDLSLNKNDSESSNSFFWSSPGSGITFSTTPAGSSSRTVVKTIGTAQPHAHILGIESSRGPFPPDEALPHVILRIQVISCHNLEPIDSSGHIDPCIQLLILLVLLYWPHPPPAYVASWSSLFWGKNSKCQCASAPSIWSMDLKTRRSSSQFMNRLNTGSLLPQSTWSLPSWTRACSGRIYWAK